MSTMTQTQNQQDTGSSNSRWLGLIMALIGGAMLMFGGGQGMGGGMGMLGLGLLAVGMIGFFAPQLFDKVGDLFSGLRDRAGREIDNVRQRFLGDDLTQDKLRTQSAQQARMTAEEKSFEEWALSDENFNKLGEQDKRDLKALLDKMRGGNDGEAVELSTIQEDEAFLDGLPPELKQQAEESLRSIQ